MSPRPSDPNRPGLWRVATDPKAIRRALGFMLVVGCILIAINHGDAILAGEVGPERWLRIGLTAVVPFLVSIISSVMAVRQLSTEHPDR